MIVARRRAWPAPWAIAWAVAWALLVIAWPAVGRASDGPEPAAVALGHWMYRWGDSPKNAGGVPEWVKPGVTPEEGWLPFEASHGEPPGRNGGHYLWFRLALPKGEWRDPSLIFDEAVEIVEAYTPGGLRYRHAPIDGPDGPRYDGNPVHVVPLQAEDLGGPLYFRIYSERREFIGIWSKILLGSRTEHLRAVGERELSSLVVAFIILLMVPLAAVLFVLHRRELSYFAFGGFALTIAIYSISKSSLWHLIAGNPVIWRYVEIDALAISPLFPGLYFDAVFGTGWRGVCRAYWVGCVGFVFAVVSLVSLHVVRVNEPIRACQLMILGGALLYGAHCVVLALRRNTEARIILTGFAVFLAAAVADVLKELGLTRMVMLVLPFGTISFLGSLSLVLGLRFMRSHEEKARVDAELSAASTVQEALLPQRVELPALDVATSYQSTARTGGDWFGHHLDTSGRVLNLYVGDVTGHGIPSALLTGVACGAIYAREELSELDARAGAAAPRDQSARIVGVAETANRVIHRTGRTQLLMSMVFASLDLETGELAFVNAGHPAPFIVRSLGGKPTALPTRGHPLGVQAEQLFKAHTVRLEPGDAVVLYTDGLLENPGPGGEVFGARLLRASLAGAFDDATALHGRVLAAANRVWKGAPPPDDVTLVTVRWLGPVSLARAKGAA